MQIDQNPKPQSQQNSSAVNDRSQQQSSQKVSEDEASRFTKELDKKNNPQKSKAKSKEGNENEQSLASIFAEQSRHNKHLSALKEKSGSKEEKGQLADAELAHALDNESDKSDEHDYEKESKVNTTTANSSRLQEQLDMSFTQIQENQLKAATQIKEVHQAKSIKEVEAALQKMADQIYVSGKEAVNGSEIRISIKDNILPATEVRIHRHGGELTIAMNTTSSDSHNFLAQHQASLQKQLEERFSSENVQLSLDMTGDMNDQNNNGSRNEYVEDERIDIDRKNKRV